MLRPEILKHVIKKSDAPIFDHLAGVFNCNKAKIMEYVDIQDNETVLKGVEEAMEALGIPESEHKKYCGQI